MDSPIDINPPRPESPESEDDPKMTIDSNLWINHFIWHAATSDPFTYKKAMARPDAKQWEIAMQEELKSQMKNRTWILVERPNNCRIVKCKWVFVIKSDSRYKAQLVAKEFTQIEEIDFQETFSPVTRYETIRFLLAHAALKNWEIEAMDIKTAFLYGELDEEIYMEQTEGFLEKGREWMVCRLKRRSMALNKPRAPGTRSYTKHFSHKVSSARTLMQAFMFIHMTR